MSYEFSNEGSTAFYADILDGPVSKTTVISAMQSDFRQFLKDNFNLNNCTK